jgi:chromosome segregation ATPase
MPDVATPTRANAMRAPPSSKSASTANEPLSPADEQLHELATGEMKTEITALKASITQKNNLLEAIATVAGDQTAAYRLAQEKLELQAEVSDMRQELRKAMGKTRVLKAECDAKGRVIARTEEALAAERKEKARLGAEKAALEAEVASLRMMVAMEGMRELAVQGKADADVVME